MDQFEYHGEYEKFFSYTLKAVKYNPDNYWNNHLLGQAWFKMGNDDEAIASFKKAVEINPEFFHSYGKMARSYMRKGNYEAAERYYEKAVAIAPKPNKYVAFKTQRNYLELREILESRNIAHIAVQYPMRSIVPLKKIFEGDDENIIFVDNEKLFRDALREGSYSDYFIDNFAGDFGHCTDRGNRLMAENIANTILKEVLGIKHNAY